MDQKTKTNFLPWLLTVLVLVVILGISYWYYIKYVQPTGTTTLNPSPTATTTTSPPASASLTYTNQDYGFTLTLPGAWQGYFMKKSTSQGTTAFYTMDLPSSDAPGVYEAFYLYVYTPTQWSAIQKEQGPIPTLINQNNQYVFAYGLNTGVPTSDWKDKSTTVPDFITNNVLSTFQFTNK